VEEVVVEEVVVAEPEESAEPGEASSPGSEERAANGSAAGHQLGLGTSLPTSAAAAASPRTDRYWFAVPDNPDEVEALLDLGESAASFSNRAFAANDRFRKGQR
jgi:hypothetical protein